MTTAITGTGELAMSDRGIKLLETADGQIAELITLLHVPLVVSYCVASR